MWINEFEIPESFLSELGVESTSSQTINRFLNNFALIGALIGSILAACSREQVEDEMITRIRLNALLTALYLQTALMIGAALFIYDLTFLSVMFGNLVALPLLFLGLLRWQLWRMRKEVRDEE